MPMKYFYMYNIKKGHLNLSRGLDNGWIINTIHKNLWEKIRK